MNKMPLEIIKIDETHAEELLNLFLAADKDYSKYFVPFEFELKAVEILLRKAKLDLNYGLLINRKLIGFYMLRGFDEGYEIPSYGVFITQKFSGQGLGQLTLFHAISQCKILNVKKLMLKVHPDNAEAKHIYEKNGFIVQGIDSKNDNLIMLKDL